VSVADVVVVILGVALIAWELWYFLVPPRMETAVPRGGVQEISVLVKQGFEPDVIPVEAGRPVRLRFYRDETAASSGDVVFDTLGLRSPLPPFETTTVEFTPLQPGDYPFRCEAGPFTGRVVAEVGREAARVNLGQGHEKHV
jgi:plastocyanin domain-containing protein